MTVNQQQVACWRCGVSRAVGPVWCPTCKAPEQPWPGVHQTYKGTLTVQGAQDTVGRDRADRRRNLLLVLPVVAVVFVVLAVMTWATAI